MRDGVMAGFTTLCSSRAHSYINMQNVLQLELQLYTSGYMFFLPETGVGSFKNSFPALGKCVLYPPCLIAV